MRVREAIGRGHACKRRLAVRRASMAFTTRHGGVRWCTLRRPLLRRPGAPWDAACCRIGMRWATCGSNRRSQMSARDTRRDLGWRGAGLCNTSCSSPLSLPQSVCIRLLQTRRGCQRGYGATAARLTPDQKVGSSNLSALIALLCGLASGAVSARAPLAAQMRRQQPFA